MHTTPLIVFATIRRRGNRPEKHARQKAHRDRLSAARQEVESKQRRNRTLGIIGAVVGVLVIIAGIVVLTGGDDDETVTSGDAPTTTVAAEPGALPEPPPGVTLTDATPCPPVDGSEERVATFAGPPPECIDPAKDYTATFETTRASSVATLDAAARRRRSTTSWC